MRQPKESPFKNLTHEIFNADGFPFRECRRCDGTGIHSHNTLTGNVCFKCQGSGNEIAPRAKDGYIAWRAHVRQQTETSVSKLVVGDEILCDETWRVIRSITKTDKPCGWSRVNNGPLTECSWYHDLEFVDGTVVTSTDCILRRRPRVLDPAPFLAMIRAPKVKKKAGSNAA